MCKRIIWYKPFAACLLIVLAFAGARICAESPPTATAIISVPLVFKEYPPIPARPTLLPIENEDGDGDYAVRWSAAARAEIYTLQERWQAGVWATVYVGADTEAALTLRPAGQYDYRLTASNAFGTSPWSEIISTTVQGDTPGSVSRPGSSGTQADGLAVVQVINDCPYALHLEFAGPEPTTTEITRCTVCEVYTFIGPIFCPTTDRPKGQVRLTPGTYRVFVSVDAPNVGSYVGEWELVADRRYSLCFYVLRR